MSDSRGGRVSLDAVRGAFDEAQTGAPLTASEVAEVVGCVRRTAHGKLQALAERGDLETKKVGARGRVWWRPPAGDDGDSTGDHDADDCDDVDEEFRSLVQAVDEYAIFRLDADGRIRSWNAGAERIKGYTREEALGRHVSTFYTETDVEDGVPERNLAEAAVRGSVETEGWRVRADGSTFWANVTITALRDGDDELAGYAKVTRDMTDRREHERDLRRERNRLERVFETSPIGIAIFDRDGRAKRANHRFYELLGTADDPGDYTLGDRPLLDGGGDPIPFAERPVPRVLSTGEPVSDRRVRVDHDDGRTRWLAVDAAPLADGEGDGVVATSVDVTQLHEQARRLERRRNELGRELDEVFDRVDDAFFALDADWRFSYVNDRAADLLGRPAAELVGGHIWEAFPEAADSPVRESLDRAMATQETVSFERYYDVLGFWVAATVYPSESGLSVYFRDVSERKARERDLERYASIVETIWDGVYALDAGGRFVMVNDAFCDLTGYDRDELLGAPSTLVTDEATDEAAVDLARSLDGGRESATLSFGLQTKDGRTVPVESRFGPYEHGEEIRFAGVVRDVTDRRAREARLERQRERLAALNNLHSVARDVTTAVIDQSTREEIERVVCERLADSDSYRFALFAGVDTDSMTIEPHVEAGVDGYFDDLGVSIDPDHPGGDGPAARAIRSKEIQVSEDVFGDPTFEPWRDLAREYDYRAAAAIPIVHESTFYGLILVYTDRRDAFTGEERSVVEQLGEVVGHAIAAVERKRALMSDELVELEFRVREFFDVDLGGTLTIDQTVAVGDGVFLTYGTATGDAIDALASVVDHRPTWESLSVLGDDGDVTRFELRLSESPVIDAVVDQGGHVERVVFEDGDLFATVHLLPESDVRQVITDIEAGFPTVELLARRQTTRPTADPGRFDETPTAALTDRQRAVLAAAYHSGYFEWPRESAGEDVAASIGVTSSTFHQHLRAAERKLLDALVDHRAADEALLDD